MNLIEGTFVPERLTEAREEQGLTKTALAENVGITRQTISNYESGTITPSADVMSRIAASLCQPIRFFFTERNRSFHLATEPSFRKLGAREATARSICKRKIERIGDALDFLYGYINRITPQFPVSVSDPLNMDEYDIESEAISLRDSLSLGHGPIDKVSWAAENTGAICFDLDIPSWVDGFSFWFRYDDEARWQPIIVASSKANYYRNRFDIAHELGHLVLHRDLDAAELEKNHDLVENQANRFASSFLMPNDTFPNYVCYTSLSALLPVKEQWGVSVAAIVSRLHQLGILTERQYKNSFIEISRKGWRKQEPGDAFKTQEKPYYMNKASQFVVDNGCCKASDFAIRLGFSNEDLKRYFANDMFLKQSGKALKFSLK